MAKFFFEYVWGRIPVREIGELLRRAREQKGITLEEAEAATKIRVRYLAAMEKGDFASLPGRPYALGFLRNYARFLGLDAQAITEELRKAWEPEKAGEPHYVVTTTGRPSTRTWRQWGSRARYLIAALVAAALLAILIPIFTAPLWSSPPEKSAAGVQKANAPAGEDLAANKDQGAQAVEQDSSQLQPQPRPEELNLTILADKGPSWLEVTVHGQPVFKGMLPLGKEMSFVAQDSITVKFGDAGAVTVKVNGREIGPVGKRGDVVRKEFRLSKEP